MLCFRLSVCYVVVVRVLGIYGYRFSALGLALIFCGSWVFKNVGFRFQVSGFMFYVVRF